MTMEELVKRLEQAMGPGRELDGAIWKVVSPDEWARNCTFKGKKYAGHIHTPAEKREHELRTAAYHSPLFTSSLDAALTLANDANMRNVLLELVAHECQATRMDIAQHGARLFCAKALRARAANTGEKG